MVSMSREAAVWFDPCIRQSRTAHYCR